MPKTKQKKTGYRGCAGGRPKAPTPDNPLSLYLNAKNISYTDAGAALDVTSQNISSIALGKSRPSSGLMFKIEEWTKGAVPMTAWFEDER